MADRSQIELLTDSVDKWKAWRLANPDVRPDFTNAGLRGAHLDNADLRNANLIGADLTHAFFHDADLCDADLTGATAAGANFCRAHLRGAMVRRAHLRRAGGGPIPLFAVAQPKNQSC